MSCTAEQTYLLSNLPGLFAGGGEAVTCVITHRLAPLLILAHLIPLFAHSLLLPSQSDLVFASDPFSRETELRQLVPQVVQESKSSGWILGLYLLAV